MAAHLVLAVTNTAVALPSSAELLEAWLAGRKETTRAAYGADLSLFAERLGYPGERAKAAELFLGSGHAVANRIAHAWRANMLAADLAPATINRRLSALRSLVTLARRLGHVEWSLDVEGVASKSYRDTSGPGLDVVRRMLAELDQAGTVKAARDRALIRLLFDRGLRRGEVVALDLADVDLDGNRVRIIGKGQTEPEWLTIGPNAGAALAAWMEHRGTKPGPLFTNMDRASKGQRLTGRSLARIVARAGGAVGAAVRPHGLRHSAITEVLEITKGNVREAARFSRHADVRTLQRYDDNRTDIGGRLAEQLGALI